MVVWQNDGMAGEMAQNGGMAEWLAEWWKWSYGGMATYLLNLWYMPMTTTMPPAPFNLL